MATLEELVESMMKESPVDFRNTIFMPSESVSCRTGSRLHRKKGAVCSALIFLGLWRARVNAAKLRGLSAPMLWEEQPFTTSCCPPCRLAVHFTHEVQDRISHG